MARTTNRSEEAEQARLIKWTHLVVVRALMPELRWLYHTPNGGMRSKLTAAQMKAIGAKAGVPDLILPVKSVYGEPGLVIEMKSATGSLSPEQIEWRDHYLAQSWRFVLCRSADEARVALCSYLCVDPVIAPPL